MLIHISLTSTSYTVCAFMHVYTCILRKSVVNISICLLWTVMTIQVRTQIRANPVCSIDIWGCP
jgi:hypothetical protein